MNKALRATHSRRASDALIEAGRVRVNGAVAGAGDRLREGDVVCIMNDPKTIQACAIAKPGVTKVEINKSGNGFIK